MAEIYGVNSQTYQRLPAEDQQAIRDGYLRREDAGAQAAAADGEVAPATPVAAEAPAVADATTAQEAVQALNAQPVPTTSDLAGMPSYAASSIWTSRVEAFNATRAGDAQAALDRLRPERADYSALNGATASMEYGDAMAHFNSDPYVQELQRIVDESSGSPATLPAYLATAGTGGGDVQQLSIEQMSSALAVLGVELPANPTPQQAAAGYELLATLPADVMGWAINPGSQVSFEGQVWAGGTTPHLPAGVNGQVSVIGEVELSDVQTGANFEQTQQFEMSVQAQFGVEGGIGRTPLNSLYKWAGRFNALPEGVQQLVEGSPLLRNVVRGLPIPVSGSYEEFAGSRLTYEAVVTPEQGAQIADGELGAAPNPLDPLSMPVGTSVLLRGQALQGSAFELNYKAFTLGSTHTELDGMGFGVHRVDANIVEVYSGPVETVENELFLGLGRQGQASIGFGNERSFEEQEMQIARIDLRTEEGQAAYQQFMSTGQVPAWSPPGVSQSGTTQIFTGESETRFEVGVGGWQWGAELNSSETVVTQTTWQDGSVEQVVSGRVGDNHLVEVSSSFDAAGEPVGSSTWRIVLADYDPALASYMQDAFNAGGESSYGDFDGGQHVQLTFTDAELMALQQMAHDEVSSTEYGRDLLAGIEAGSAASNDFNVQLALADTPGEVFAVIGNDFHQFQLAERMLGMSLSRGDDIPGQIRIRDAG